MLNLNFFLVLYTEVCQMADRKSKSQTLKLNSCRFCLGFF